MMGIGGPEIKSAWFDLIPHFLLLFYENDITDSTSQREQEFNVVLIALGNVWNLGFAA